MVEANPEHPVTRELHDQWHKICLLLVKRFGARAIVITAADVVEMSLSKDKYLIAYAQHDGLHVIVATDEEAEIWLKRGVH
jgi:hypothetical protein